jgi:hypothetical protein
VPRGERKAACEHVGVGTAANRHHAAPVEVERSAFLCPMHPSELFCDFEGCTEAHEPDGPMPIFAEIQLHRGVPVSFQEPSTDGLLTDLSFEYCGVLVMTAMSWLCSEHVEAIELPARKVLADDRAHGS